MAFNFYGTFTTGQWESFKAFTKIQAFDIQLRINWLQKQLEMNGVFTTEYGDDGSTPVQFSANNDSYADKLLKAYKVLGGVPELDMLLRSRQQPVFLTASRPLGINKDTNTTDGGYSEVFSNGRRWRGNQRFDRDLGIKIERVKNIQLEPIKLKRERLEFKIKRALDYSDQLSVEISLLETALRDSITRGSVEFMITDIEVTIATPGAANVVDNLSDVFGLFIGKIGDYDYDDALSKAQQRSERLPRTY